MEYHEIEPTAALSSLVQCYWILEDHSPIVQTQTIVPDGRCELIMNLGTSFEQSNSGHWNSQPEIMFVGQITRPLVVRPRGPAKTIGIRFRPAGAIRLLRQPMYELSNTIVGVDDISQKLYRKLDRLRDLTSTSEQLTVLERILLAEIGKREEDQLVSVAVGEFEKANGLVAIRDVADWLGFSSRQLERRFRSAVGISPKLFCRLQRFQRVFQALENANGNWVQTALSCGYYDQSHLIRDFHEFSGTTPTEMDADTFDLTRLFAQP